MYVVWMCCLGVCRCECAVLVCKTYVGVQVYLGCGSM